MRPAAVLFDLDGTLVDTEPRSQAAWALLLRRHGIRAQDLGPESFAGRPGREALADHLAWFPGHTVEELFDEVLACLKEPGLPGSTPTPGAVELVRRLAADRVRLGVVTSGTREHAETELAAAGILGLLDVVVTADDVERGKPDPEGYLLGCAALDADPNSTVVFEDSPVGVLAAKRSGAYCVGVLTSHGPDVLHRADLTVRTLAEVAWPVPWSW